MLDAIGIAAYPALKHLRRAADIGDALGKITACAAFCHRYLPLFFGQQPYHRCLQVTDVHPVQKFAHCLPNLLHHRLEQGVRVLAVFHPCGHPQLYLAGLGIGCHRRVQALFHQTAQPVLQHRLSNPKKVHGVGDQPGVAVLEQIGFDLLLKHRLHLPRRTRQHDGSLAFQLAASFDCAAGRRSVFVLKDDTALRHHRLLFIIVGHLPA